MQLYIISSTIAVDNFANMTSLNRKDVLSVISNILIMLSLLIKCKTSIRERNLKEKQIKLTNKLGNR